MYLNSETKRKTYSLWFIIVALPRVFAIDSAAVSQAPTQVFSTARETVASSGVGEPGLDSTQTSERIDAALLSENCFARRDEILLKSQKEFANESSKTGGASLDAGQFVPQCRPDGKFEPIQCNKIIGSCWCVNKHGQPIRNSAFKVNAMPCQPPDQYDDAGPLVVGALGGDKLDSLLLESPGFSSSTRVAKQDFGLNLTVAEKSEPLQARLNPMASQQPDEDFKKRLNGAEEEPSLTLGPNECGMSRRLASERASKFSDNNIWIPQCDSSNEKLYAKKQCHSSSVCWCVDQSTGLPLPSSQPAPISTAQPDLNCTEMRQTIEWVGARRAQHGACDVQRRARFMRSLMDQFRVQIGEYMSRHPNGTKPPGMASPDPRALPDSQVLSWKFSLLDADQNGRLEDREWCKFKMNFRLVDGGGGGGVSRAAAAAGALWSPLSIPRLERLCWRDLLELCAGGKLLVRDSIDLARWAACMGAGNGNGRGTGVGGARGEPDEEEEGQAEAWRLDRSRASTREAAIARSRTKNPFAGILRPD